MFIIVSVQFESKLVLAVAAYSKRSILTVSTEAEKYKISFSKSRLGHRKVTACDVGPFAAYKPIETCLMSWFDVFLYPCRQRPVERNILCDKKRPKCLSLSMLRWRRRIEGIDVLDS